MWTTNPVLWLLFILALASGIGGLLLTLTWKPDPDSYVQPHEAQQRLRVRLLAPVWGALPGRIQGRICGCPTCRGSA